MLVKVGWSVGATWRGAHGGVRVIERPGWARSSPEGGTHHEALVKVGWGATSSIGGFVYSWPPDALHHCAMGATWWWVLVASEPRLPRTPLRCSQPPAPTCLPVSVPPPQMHARFCRPGSTPPPSPHSVFLPHPQVHAGFFKAWTHHGFSTRVLARIQELQAGAPAPLRIWITGGRVGADGWEE